MILQIDVRQKWEIFQFSIRLKLTQISRHDTTQWKISRCQQRQDGFVVLLFSGDLISPGEQSRTVFAWFLRKTFLRETIQLFKGSSRHEQRISYGYAKSF